MLIIKDKYLYVHFPKTGGYFVRDTLGKIGLCRDVETIHSSIKEVYGTKKCVNLKTVTTIRNPWAWYVSLWAFRNDYKKDHINNSSIHHPTKFWNHWSGFDVFIRDVMNQSKNQKYTDSDIITYSGEYKFLGVRYMTNKNVGLYTTYWKDLCFFDYKDCIDKYMLTENLNQNMIETFELSKSESDLVMGEKRANVSAHDDYRNYYTDETRKMVETKDREIIAKFRYEF